MYILIDPTTLSIGYNLFLARWLLILPGLLNDTTSRGILVSTFVFIK